MDFETLIKEVANADRVPDAALSGLMPHAAELAPRLEALARRRMEGDWLYPSEDNLLFYGLFVLAAANERRFWPIWVELLSVSDDGLEDLFGDGAIMSIRAITLGLVGADADIVAELAVSAELAYVVHAGLTEALARLMCEGKYPREKFIALIDRLAILEGTEDDDRCKTAYGARTRSRFGMMWTKQQGAKSWRRRSRALPIWRDLRLMGSPRRRRRAMRCVGSKSSSSMRMRLMMLPA